MMALLLVGVCSPNAEAGKKHCGDITSDESWGPGDNPHVVECEVTVKSGATLSIAAGAQVRFTGYYSIFVEGRLRVAVNGANEPVLFTSTSQSPAAGDWRSIRFNDSASDDSYIASAVIEYPDYAVDLDHASPLFINWTVMRNNTYGLRAVDSTPWLANTTVEYSELDGIHLLGFDPDARHCDLPPLPPNEAARPCLENATVRDGGRYGAYVEDSPLNATSSAFLRNARSGVYWIDPDDTTRSVIAWSEVSDNALDCYLCPLEDNFGIALLWDDAGPSEYVDHNPRIAHNAIDGNPGGVYVTFPAPDVVWNDIGAGAGVFMEDAKVYVNNNTIEAIEGGVGVLSFESISEIFDNAITTVGDLSTFGIEMWRGSETLIVDNSIEYEGSHPSTGIWACRSHVTAWRNAITDYSKGIAYEYASSPPGDCPGPDSWLLDAQNNTITSTVGDAIGIYVDDDITVNVRNNSLSGLGGYGVKINGASGVVANNSIETNGIGVSVTDGVVVRANNIENNIDLGASNSGGTSGTVDARWNWWGHSSGPYDESAAGACSENPGSGNPVLDDSTSYVNYCGAYRDWLTSAADTGPYT